MGLTLVAAPGGTPLHLDVRMSLSTVSGTWRDSTGQNGAWALSPGPPAGGGPRPPSRVLFPAGVSAGGAAVTNVGPPVLSTDAATKGYVDSGDAGGRAYANAVATAAVPISAVTATVIIGNAVVSQALGAGDSLRGPGVYLVMDLPVPVGGSFTTIIVRYITRSQSPR